MMEFLQDAETWIAVAFLIALVIMLVKAVPVVLASLDARSAQISAELEEARTLRQEAEAMLAAYAAKQKAADSEAREIVEHAKSDAELMIKDAETELALLLQRREQQAKERIRRLETEALAEIRAAAAEVALAAAARVLTESIDQNKGSTLIDEAIAALPASLTRSKLGVATV